MRQSRWSADVNLFDTHTHLDFEDFGDDRERRIRVNNAAKAHVRTLLVPGYAPSGWAGLAALEQRLQPQNLSVRILTASGIHPFALGALSDEVLARGLAALPEALSGRVAVGECGLDFRTEWTARVDRTRQVNAVRAQLDIARRVGMPALLHCVRAHPALLGLLQERPTPPSVLHGFTGSAELAQRYTDLGHYVSFGGALTLPDARRVVQACRAVPADRMLVETDAPDQTPHRRRPAMNEPAFLIDVVEALASHRGVPTEEVADQTTANAWRLFGPQPQPAGTPG